MKIQLIRHATLWLEYSGVKFLVDPMFSDAGANPPIPLTPNRKRNPLVALPSPVDTWTSPDAVIVTHLHPDHWDEPAAAALAKTVPVLCQSGDEGTLASAGFETVTPIDSSFTLGAVTISRTSGQHGRKKMAVKMGKVSGFILQAEGEPTVYIAGDTIWCDDVKQALDEYRPDITIVNAGGARFLMGGAITMDDADVIALCQHAPYTKVIAVHMESINHCIVKRDDLHRKIEPAGLQHRVLIPQDGEWI